MILALLISLSGFSALASNHSSAACPILEGTFTFNEPGFEPLDVGVRTIVHSETLVHLEMTNSDSNNTDIMIIDGAVHDVGGGSYSATCENKVIKALEFDDGVQTAETLMSLTPEGNLSMTFTDANIDHAVSVGIRK